MRAADDLRALPGAFEEHDLLTSASAIAFQVLSAAIPLVLVALALLGFFDLERVWRDIARDIRPDLSPAAFEVVDSTVRKVIGSKQWFWLTLGALLTVWRMSSAMRAVSGALDRVYDSHRDRPLLERLRVSLLLGLAVTLLLLGAAAAVAIAPLALPVDGTLPNTLSIVLRWGVAGLLALLAVGLVVHHAPADPQPVGWVSFGSVLCVTAWLVCSVAFGLYVTKIASYGSLFGSFASLFVLLTYLYVSAVALLAGAELDARVRRRNGA